MPVSRCWARCSRSGRRAGRAGGASRRLRLDRPRARRARRARRPAARGGGPRRGAACSCACRAPTARASAASWTPGWTAWSSRGSTRPRRRAASSTRCATRRADPAGSRRAGRPATGGARGARRSALHRPDRERGRGGGGRAIAAVEGVDALVVGCADLALALGGTARAGLAATARGDRARAGRRREAGIASGIAGPEDPELTAASCAARAACHPAGLLAESASTRAAGRGCVSAPEAWHVTRTLRAMELLAVRPRSAPELADGARGARAHRAPSAEAARSPRAT